MWPPVSHWLLSPRDQHDDFCHTDVAQWAGTEARDSFFEFLWLPIEGCASDTIEPEYHWYRDSIKLHTHSNPRSELTGAPTQLLVHRKEAVPSGLRHDAGLAQSPEKLGIRP